jgi:hypothetical protein
MQVSRVLILRGHKTVQHAVLVRQYQIPSSVRAIIVNIIKHRIVVVFLIEKGEHAVLNKSHPYPLTASHHSFVHRTDPRDGQKPNGAPDTHGGYSSACLHLITRIGCIGLSVKSLMKRKKPWRQRKNPTPGHRTLRCWRRACSGPTIFSWYARLRISVSVSTLTSVHTSARTDL